MTFLLKLWKWLRNIPVLFAHFPGPSLMLVMLACLTASAFAVWITHHLEAGARATLRTQLAEARAQYADQRTAAATARADTIKAAASEQAAINAETARAMQDAMRAFVDAKQVSAPALAALGRQIEELHRDAKFACRREPLPADYLGGLFIPARPVPATDASAAGSDSGDRPAGDAVPARDP